MEEIEVKREYGWMAVVVEDDVLYVEDIVVEEKERGKGYGKRFVEEAIRMAKERGCREVWIEAVHWKMERIVRKLGFERDGSEFGWRKEVRMDDL